MSVRRAPRNEFHGIRPESIGRETRREIVRSLSAFLQLARADGGSIWLIDGGERWRLLLARGLSAGVLEELDGIETTPAGRRLFESGKLFVRAMNDPLWKSQTARTRRKLEHAGVGSYAAAPLIVGGRVLGMLAMSFQSRSVPDATKLGFLRVSARQMGLALETAQQLEESRARVRALAAFGEVSALVAGSLELPEVLARIVGNAARVVEATDALLFLRDESGVLVGAAGTRRWARIIKKTRIPPGERSIVTVALSTLRPQVVFDVRSDPRSSSRLQGTFGSRGLVALPLIAYGNTVGALTISDRRRPRQFSDEELRMLIALASQAAIAIHHARIHEELRAHERELRILSKRVVDAHESERRRIARELHDVVGQGLAAIGLELALVEKSVGVECAAAAGHAGHARKLLRETSQAARRLSAELHPGILDDLGLVPALRWFCSEIARRTSLSVALRTRELPALNPRAMVVFYRAVQEALSNVLRHSGAKHATVSLRPRGSNVVLEIRDDGRGIHADPAARTRPGVGLLAIRERAATLGGRTRLEAPAGGGARLVVEIPADRALATHT